MYKKTIILFVILSLFCGCKKREEPVVEKPLLPISFSEVTGWNNESFEDFIPAFAENCKKIITLQQNLKSSMFEINLSDYKKVCIDFFNTKQFSKTSLRFFLEKNFNLYKIKDQNSGIFTSYYAPFFDASLTKKGAFLYPLLAKPDDGIVINLQDFDKSFPQKQLLGKIQNGKLIPYDERKDIVKKTTSSVLLWLKNFSDIVDLQTQGSGIAKLEDDSLINVSYDISNNLEFKGMGKILIEKNILQSGAATSLHVKRWIKNNPEEAMKLFNENKRFVFHKTSPLKNVTGAFGTALLAQRSLAVDKNFIPLGTLLWLDTKGPDKENVKKLVFAHDTGADIVGKIRGDLFWGVGDDTVLEKSGKMKNNGFYYILLPKSVLENVNEKK